MSLSIFYKEKLNMKNLIINSDDLVTAYKHLEKFRKYDPEIMYKERTVNTNRGRKLTKVFLTVVNMEGKNGRMQDTIRQHVSGMEYGPRGNTIVSEVDGGSFECKV